MTAANWPGWETGRLLGEGSFGRVYEIRKEEFGVAYKAALKVITIPQSQSEIQAAFQDGMDEESVTRYFRSFVEDIVAEFGLMSQLKGNSNVVSYEDHMIVQHEDGIGWDILIRMELLTPLLQYAAGRELEEAEILKLGIDMCRALELCRKKDIIHRDVKPENIFVSDNGDFKLGDFGIARVIEKTTSGLSKKGTYTYMAPEVYRGDAYGFGADIYSLGVVLYRFLNRSRTPFLPAYPDPIRYMDREQAVNRRVAGEAIPEPCTGSSRLKAAVLKACAYEPSERFASAQEFRRELEAIRSGAAVRPEPAGEAEIRETAAEKAPEVKAEPEAKAETEPETMAETKATTEPEAEKEEAGAESKEKKQANAKSKEKKPKRKDKSKETPAPDAGAQTVWWKQKRAGWLFTAAAFALGYLVLVKQIERVGTYSGIIFMRFAGRPLETDYIALHMNPQGFAGMFLGVVLTLAQVYWLPCLLGAVVLSVSGRLWTGIWSERSIKKIAGFAAIQLLVFLGAGKITQALLIAFYLLTGSFQETAVIVLPTAAVFFGAYKLWQRRCRKKEKEASGNENRV